MWKFPKRNKQKTDDGHWRTIPFLLDNDGYGYVINRDGVVRKIDSYLIQKPYPYPEEFGGDLVCIAVGKFFCYIDGPALADVMFDKPGSDASRHCVFFTGYKQL